MIRYCLPLQLAHSNDIERHLQDREDRFHFFEIWLDLLEDLTTETLLGWIERWPDRLLFLFRRPQLAPIQMPARQRQQLLHTLAGQRAYVDLDIETQPDDVAYIAKESLSLRLIASSHHYDETPAKEALRATIEKMTQAKATIYKLAAFCQTQNDALRLMQLAQELSQEGKEHIVLGMGPYGLITRVFGTLWSNAMIFAPDDLQHASAPGQLTRQQLDDIFRILEPLHKSNG